MQILGLSGLYHDSAAALIKNGEIIAAAQEERFTRLKHDESFPLNAITYCLKTADADLNEIDLIAFYDKPFLKFERLLETYVSFAPAGFQSFSMAMPIWLRNKLFQKDLLLKEFKKFSNDFDYKTKLLFAEHHQSHAASAFYPSPFDEAVVLTIDGVGEWATTSVAMGSGNNLKVIKELHFPHSLGLLYSAFTYYTGFKVNSGEYKLMGLAPYGKPKYVQTIFENLIDVKEDGTFRLDQSYFDYCTGLRMTNNKFDKLFGGPPIKPGALITEREMDLACSIQVVTEEIMLRLTRSLAKETKVKNLCLAGGVALNCVANGKILKDGAFQNIWIQPAAGDAGGALGAALCAYHHHKNQPRASQTFDRMKGSYLGPEYTDREIQERLEAIGAKFEILDETEMVEKTAIALTKSKAIGWFQGRMEFGPRALGGRSILGDPRSPEMQKMLNLKIKYRESFRPFAPSVRREDVSDWFELNTESPYMLLVAEVIKKRQKKMTTLEQELFGIEKLNVVRSEIPAVTHVDYSARIQTVSPDINPKYHALLSKFNDLTSCPVIANTSFNVRGEPIVCTPEDAFRCFMGCSMEVLSIGNQMLYKENQDPTLALDYKDLFELD
ncbi:carbamoyltransferase [Gammaproteobacteria bacterium]|nr:carbamoyltransferase [Gammaproteobacteria bacterium]